MRLTLVISSLSCGGAEKVMSVMANYWAMKGRKITVLTFDDGSDPPFYDITPSVCHRPLNIATDSWNLWQGLQNNVRRIRILRKAILKSKADVIISFLNKINVVTLLSCLKTDIPVIISERNDPYMNCLGRTWSTLRDWTYPLAECIVVQTKTIADFFPKKIRSKTRIIPNPVLALKHDPHLEAKRIKKPTIVAMGKFHRQKGFDLLLNAFARLQDKYPKWTMTIFGEGRLWNELNHLRDSLGLSNRVFFPGQVKNAQHYLRQADIFVMPSRYEGFPNVLCEAMAIGVAVIATDCPSVAEDIIHDGTDGILVPRENVDALEAAMDRLMANAKERKKLASRAPEILRRFGTTKVMALWEQAIVAQQFLIL